jgi:hypothetical protein
MLPYAQIASYADAPNNQTLVFGPQNKVEGADAVFNIIPHLWDTLV